MEVRWIPDAGGVEVRSPDELASLLRRTDGLIWVDVPDATRFDPGALRDAFGFDEAEIADCGQRSLVPKVIPHDDRDYVFFILHTLDDEGHLLELDAFLGPRYLVTVHGPLTTGVPLELAQAETNATLDKLKAGTFRPATADHLAHDVIAGIELSLEQLLFRTAANAGALDRRAREGKTGKAEGFLEEIFHVRHGLTTVRNRAGQSKQACHTLAVFEPVPERKALFQDLEQRFERLTALCDGEREFVQGVLDFFESITNTRMNAAMNRLALISFIVLPASALIGFFGISSISYDRTNLRDTIFFAFLLLLLTLGTLRWTKSKGWW